MDRAAIRYWLCVATAALVVAAVVGHAVSSAEDARRAWGRSRTVWVTDRAVGRGSPARDAVRRERWPVALVPPGAIDQVPRSARIAADLPEGVPLTQGALASRGDGAGTDRRLVVVPVEGPGPAVREGDLVDAWAVPVDATGLEAAPRGRRVAAAVRVVERRDDAVVVAVAPDDVAPVVGALAVAPLVLVGRP